MRRHVFLAALATSLASPAAPIPDDAIWVDAQAAAGGTGSKGAPYAKIGLALKAAQRGGTVVVRAGTYRESVSVPGGQPGRPTTLMAVPGERAIVSGLRPVTGWAPVGGGVYRANLQATPTRLFVGLRKQPLAREPNEGWLMTEEIQQEEGRGALICSSLRGAKLDPTGGKAYVWSQHGNNFFTVSIAAMDQDTGTLSVGITSKWLKLKDGDKFYLINHPALIDRPGEWAAVQGNGGCQLYFRPEREADLRRVEVPVETRRVVHMERADHVRLVGLDVVGSDKVGIELSRGRDLVVESCRSYLNGGGISLRDCQDSRVRRNLVMYSEGNGVSLHTTRGIVVEENEIGWNGVDGLVVAWNTHYVDVRRNYIHDHLLWGHPDNLQMYRTVSNIRVVDNLLLAGGQTIMMEQASDLLFQGNMFVGCAANMLIFGHGNAKNARIVGNTLAFPGYSCFSLTSENYEVRRNIFAMGHGGTFYGVRGVKGYQGDHNLFWAGPGQEGGLPDGKAWHRSVASFQKANPDLEAHSKVADPQFVSAPVAYAVLDSKRLNQCTRARLYLRDGNGGRFAAGDVVEINFDGVPRQVVTVDAASITVEPPLDEIPPKPYVVANWKTNRSLRLDLRVGKDSPAHMLGPEEQPVGSTLDIPAIRRGDFDGDGERDVPSYPADASWRPM